MTSRWVFAIFLTNLYVDKSLYKKIKGGMKKAVTFGSGFGLNDTFGMLRLQVKSLWITLLLNNDNMHFYI